MKSMVTIFTGVEMAVFGQSLLKCRKKLAFRQLQSFEDCICSKFRKETNEANPQKGHEASQAHAKREWSRNISIHQRTMLVR